MAILPQMTLSCIIQLPSSERISTIDGDLENMVQKSSQLRIEIL
ncbi:hypothetical protein SAMN06265370_111154 [Puniceibacterium sediminis]|uniref:Uncharacterized protein n=1 Tax=Puniceibacterium sediminis TaxID=1608407 RepID=A0A238XMH8_9RHOB|nr:hypothetical protein SAMN06265370_111154 [Puniceibacterium sediminis]